MAVAVAAVAGRMVEVGDMPPAAAVDTAVAAAVAVVDTAVAVDTEVAASETLNCVVPNAVRFRAAFSLGTCRRARVLIRRPASEAYPLRRCSVAHCLTCRIH